MEGTLMKIKIHNSLSLKHEYDDYTEYLLNETFLRYWSEDEKLYFWTKISDYHIGHITKNGSLKENSYITLIPLDLKSIKSLKWKELDS